jgi:uncharacterized membrane protein YhaH (DUF805 family)
MNKKHFYYFVLVFFIVHVTIFIIDFIYDPDGCTILWFFSGLLNSITLKRLSNT